MIMMEIIMITVMRMMPMKTMMNNVNTTEDDVNYDTTDAANNPILGIRLFYHSL